MRTINGQQVKSAKVFTEGCQWRWRILDVRGAEYLDGGNYASREAAERGLDDAYDPPTDPQVAKLLSLLKDGGYTQVDAARDLGLSPRMMRYYCAGTKPVPLSVMLALTHLVVCAPSQ